MLKNKVFTLVLAVISLTPAAFALKTIHHQHHCAHLTDDGTISTIMSNAPTDQPIVNQAIHDGLNAHVADVALKAYQKAESEGKSHSKIFTIIDYSLPSDQKRMWVFDLSAQKLLFHNVVAHGKNSGSKMARSFSNANGSHKTSLGLYVTEGTYNGHKGLSLRLAGLEKGINDNAEQRAIVVHGANYANPGFVSKMGRLGRSWGCPAVPVSLVKPIIQTIKGGSLMFMYANDASYLHQSDYI